MLFFVEYQEEDRNLGLQLTNSSNQRSQQPHEQQQQHEHQQANNLESTNSSAAANNAAFMALRANPETTIRPLNSGSGLGSPDASLAGIAGGSGTASSAVVPGVTSSADHLSATHDPQFSAASDLINRYRLEQTINQLRGHHSFGTDPRGITGLPFNQHNQV